MTKHAIFLRGINVGGHNRFSMARLRELLCGLGCEDVRTHLQSGNAVFNAADSSETMRTRVAERIALELGLDVRVFARDREGLASIVAGNPLAEVATDPAKQLVVFLSEPLEQESVAALGSLVVEPERFAARGRELHLWCPNGVRQTKLTNAAIERRLRDSAAGRGVAARNWATVTKMVELLDALGQ